MQEDDKGRQFLMENMTTTGVSLTDLSQMSFYCVPSNWKLGVKGKQSILGHMPCKAWTCIVKNRIPVT